MFCGLTIETNFMVSADATFLGQTLTIALRQCVSTYGSYNLELYIRIRGLHTKKFGNEWCARRLVAINVDGILCCYLC